MVEAMRVNLPGLLIERTSSGAVRYRVRPAGNKTRRIKLTVPPDHPDFSAQYNDARNGQEPRQAKIATAAIPRSLAWLMDEYENAMAAKVRAGLMDAGTAKQRTAFYARLRPKYGDKHMEMPRAKVIEIRDSMAATPGAADNMVKSLRALFAWAVESERMKDNPAKGIGKINRGTGAIAWSVDDLEQFRQRHPKGTMPHLALTLMMFTACRIGDVVTLGRGNEVKRDGITYLAWNPGKRGSAPVTVPVLPPLAEAIAAQKVVGSAYLLNAHGKPFASGAAFGNWFRDRVSEAGLTDRSPHGIRKAAGELMALAGATQYHIMAVLGHSNAKTSEVYTQGVNRQRLAEEAVNLMRKMNW
jgi:integrase